MIHCPRVPGYGTTECGCRGEKPRGEEESWPRGRVTQKHTRVRATRDAQTRDAQTCAYPCTQVARRAFLRCERARAADQSLQAGPARGVLCFLGRYFRRSCCHRALVSDRFCLSILYPPHSCSVPCFGAYQPTLSTPRFVGMWGGLGCSKQETEAIPPQKAIGDPEVSASHGVAH